MDETLRATRCTDGSGGCMRDADGAQIKCQTHDLWDELGQQIHFFLSGITLADVLEGRVLGRAVRLADPALREVA